MEATGDIVEEVVGDAVDTVVDVAGDALTTGAILAVSSSRWRSKGMVLVALLVVGIGIGLLIKRNRDQQVPPAESLKGLSEGAMARSSG